MKRYPYAKYIKIPANTKDWERIRLFTNDEQAKKLKNIGVWFSAGCEDYVKVRFYIDGEPVPMPSEGTDDYYMGDDVRYPIMINKDITKNSVIEIEYKNEDNFAHLIGVTWETEEIIENIYKKHAEHKEKKEEGKEDKQKNQHAVVNKKVVKVIPKSAKEVIADIAKELGGGR